MLVGRGVVGRWRVILSSVSVSVSDTPAAHRRLSAVRIEMSCHRVGRSAVVGLWFSVRMAAGRRVRL